MAGRRFHAGASVIRVLDTPGQTFHNLAEEPAIVPPYIVNTLLGAVAAALSLPVTLRFVEAQFMERGMQGSSFLTSTMLFGGVLGALFGPLIAGLLIAALVFGMLWIGGQAVTFRSIFSLVGYARIPLSIGALIHAFLVTRAISPTQASRLSLSAAALAPSGTSPLLTGFLSTVGPFSLWYFVLVTLGVAAVTRRAVQRVWWVAAVLYGLNLLMVLLGSGLSTATLQ